MLPLRNNKTHFITDRYMLGGPTSLRGFEMAGVGPHSDGCALGAEVKINFFYLESCFNDLLDYYFLFIVAHF